MRFRCDLCLRRHSPSTANSVKTRRLGMTIIEVLIATAMTLLIMLALAQGFKTLSESVSAGRAKLVGSDQLRGLSSLLRSDLEGLTTDSSVIPQRSTSASGYFEYYDGPISDSTAMLFNYMPTAPSVESRLSASRWGDIDDVVMFTAKAKQGDWFRGRVPLGLLKIHQANVLGVAPSVLPDPLTVSDWNVDVSIASEFAEVVWFMRPLDNNGSIVVDGIGPYSTTPPNTEVIDVAPGVDVTGDNIPDPDGMPDRIALCRRTLLIRPDLNLTLNPSWGSSVYMSSDLQLTARPLTPDVSITDSLRFMMRFVYQRCDLSLRPLLLPSMVDGGMFCAVTNDLADLQRPENRFAHYVMPVATGGLGTPTDCYLPILALSSEAPATLYRTMTDMAYGSIGAPLDRGFVPSCFSRTKISSSGGAISSVQPTLEEVIASNVVAFDVRGFDPSARQFLSPGIDGLWGSTGAIADAGFPGTDDLVLGPSDPGYTVAATTVGVPNANGGAYVDLGWGTKVTNQLINGATPKKYVIGNSTAAPVQPPNSNFITPLSGWDTALAIPAGVSDSLILSGRYSLSGIYQPTFDTFTDAYESDGYVQNQGIWYNGLVRFGVTPASNLLAPDQGTNGVDDNGDNIVDDFGEHETSPPFNYRMPSVQIKFRVLDVKAGTLQELSMVHDLTGN